MTTRFKTSLVTGLAVLTMAAAAPMLMAEQDQQQGRRGPGIGAHGGPGMRGGPRLGFAPGFRQLDLSDDQKAQLKKIAEARRTEFEAVGEKVRAAREGMRALVEADSVNEAAIRAKSAEIAAAEADVMILNAKVRQEQMQVLTSEQQQKLKELRASREGQRKQRGPRPQQQ